WRAVHRAAMARRNGMPGSCAARSAPRAIIGRPRASPLDRG
ncbi:MAG: hypothetical protein AVDCRST_MAG13-2529, partial [uncultured Solirubrobacteraceae bacterium]